MDVELVDDQFVQAYIGEWLALSRVNHTQRLVYEPYNEEAEALTVAIMARHL